MSRSHDLDETLSNVVDLVAKRLDADVCSLYLCGSDLSKLVLSATVGLHREAVGRVELNLDEGLVGLAAERKAPVVIERASEHPRYKYFPETGEERFESLMAAPLIVRGMAMGVLTVQTTVRRHFDQGDVDTLVTCAQLLTPVVVNALTERLDVVHEQPEVSLRNVLPVWHRGARQAAVQRSEEVAV